MGWVDGHDLNPKERCLARVHVRPRHRVKCIVFSIIIANSNSVTVAVTFGGIKQRGNNRSSPARTGRKKKFVRLVVFLAYLIFLKNIYLAFTFIVIVISIVIFFTREQDGRDKIPKRYYTRTV